MGIVIALHFHYFISLETANTQKSEVFLLKISSGNCFGKKCSVSWGSGIPELKNRVTDYDVIKPS